MGGRESWESPRSKASQPFLVDALKQPIYEIKKPIHDRGVYA